MFKLFKSVKSEVQDENGVYDDVKEDLSKIREEYKKFNEEHIKFLVQDAWIRGKAGIPLNEKYDFDNERGEVDEGY